MSSILHSTHLKVALRPSLERRCHPVNTTALSLPPTIPGCLGLSTKVLERSCLSVGYSNLLDSGTSECMYVTLHPEGEELAR